MLDEVDPKAAEDFRKDMAELAEKKEQRAYYEWRLAQATETLKELDSTPPQYAPGRLVRNATRMLQHSARRVAEVGRDEIAADEAMLKWKWRDVLAIERPKHTATLSGVALSPTYQRALDNSLARVAKNRADKAAQHKPRTRKPKINDKVLGIQLPKVRIRIRR